MRTTRETVPRYLDQVKKLADAKREAAETCFSIVSTLCRSETSTKVMTAPSILLSTVRWGRSRMPPRPILVESECDAVAVG
jgi:hypothetical protein